jgi:cyanophycinase-like exopeptidase
MTVWWLGPQAPVHNATEALQLLRKAAKARQSAETAANPRSSRSHAVFTVGGEGMGIVHKVAEQKVMCVVEYVWRGGEGVMVDMSQTGSLMCKAYL